MSQSAVHPAAEVAVVSGPEGDVVNAGRALGQKGSGPKTLSTVPACGPDDSCLSSPVCWHNSPCLRAVPNSPCPRAMPSSTGSAPPSGRRWRGSPRAYCSYGPCGRSWRSLPPPFDRRCRTDTALGKLARLRRFRSVGQTLQKLSSPNLEKALTFLDDRLVGSTSNAVERGNRRYRNV